MGVFLVKTAQFCHF